MFNNKRIRKTISLVALACAAGYAIGMLGILPATGGVAYQDIQVVGVSEEVGSTTWRYTKNGWEDIGGMYTDSFVPIQSFELVHPLVWAASVLFAVIGTSIWASNEWEIARLVNQKSGSDGRNSSVEFNARKEA